MATLIICKKKDCIYAKERIDGFYQCSATIIGITEEDKCDTIWENIYPEFAEKLRLLKPGKPCGHPGCCNHTTHPCEKCGRINCGLNN